MSRAARFKAFISYAHQDAAWAVRLQRKLENYQAPDRSEKSWPLRPIFLDRSDLSSSPDLSESIEQALRDSEALIIVCSPAAAQSKWVNAEILSKSMWTTEQRLRTLNAILAGRITD